MRGTSWKEGVFTAEELGALKLVAVPFIMILSILLAAGFSWHSVYWRKHFEELYQNITLKLNLTSLLCV